MSEDGAGREQLSIIFHKQLQEIVTKTTSQSTTNSFVALPYVQGNKPSKTVNSLFPHPNTQSDADCPKSGTVYEISCTNCNFVYYGQTERTLKIQDCRIQKGGCYMYVRP